MKFSDDAIVQFTSSDQRTIQIPVKAAKISQLVVTTLFPIDDDDDDEDDDDDNDEGGDSSTKQLLEMDVPRVDGTTLEKVVEFLIHYEQNPFPKMPERLPGNDFSACVQGEWYTNFMTNLAGNGKQDMDLFYKVKSAANFMDINPLLEMICLWLTFKITELKEAEPIRELLRLPRMTEEEERTARQQHPWMFE